MTQKILEPGGDVTFCVISTAHPRAHRIHATTVITYSGEAKNEKFILRRPSRKLERWLLTLLLNSLRADLESIDDPAWNVTI